MILELLGNLQPWHWALLAVVLVILEILAPGIYFLWMGIAATMPAAMLWLCPELGWQAQFLAFALFSIASVAVGRVWLNRSLAHSDEPTLNRRGEQYIGRVVTLEEPIVDGLGRIRLDDTIWKVQGPDCETGSRVRITGTQGVVLRVEKVDAS